MAMAEMRAGQPLTLKWYENVDTLDGEQRRASSLGTEFWAKQSEPSQATREFRSAIEGVKYSVVIASTNLSKLEGIEKGCKVLYKSSLRNVETVTINGVKGVAFIALS